LALMNAIAVAFLIINGGLLLSIPRHWAPLPLLVGACYMTLGQTIELGPLNFPVLRILLAVGFARVIIRLEHLLTRMNGLDWLMILWAAWALISSLFHSDPFASLVNRLGLVYNGCGIYFLLRIFCQSLDDAVRLCRITAILLIPLSIEMLSEKFIGYNLFSALGGVSEMPDIRGGKIRAQGPFSHSILAGTIGAVCLPLIIGLWQSCRRTSIAGTLACIIIIFSSSSSGPILSALFAIGALLMWNWRRYMRNLRLFVIFGFIGLNLVMEAPVYYLIARLDLTGNSTSWHRAALIDAALEHLPEWWLVGTDYTRHWLPYGVPWSSKHIDITNHYIAMGVNGGLLLMLLLIAILAKGFSFVGQALRHQANFPLKSQFMVWALGASLFSHSATFISVSYFDQSFVFLYLTLTAICAASTQTIQSSVSKGTQHNNERLPLKSEVNYEWMNWKTGKKRALSSSGSNSISASSRFSSLSTKY
jgi:hypothetical protein